jgi:hypothetical protein
MSTTQGISLDKIMGLIICNVQVLACFDRNIRDRATGADTVSPRVQVLMPTVVNGAGDLSHEVVERKIDKLAPGHMEAFIGQKLHLPVGTWANATQNGGVISGLYLLQDAFAQMYPLSTRKAA